MWEENMNNITEIVYGDSTYHTISHSKLNQHKIIKFNTYFSVGNLEDIDNYKISVPKWYLDDNIYDFAREMSSLDESIKANHKIRVWCSRDDVNSYILLLFITNYLKDKCINLSVIYSGDFDSDHNQSPSLLREEELEALSNFEHEITKNDFIKLADIYNDIKDVKCDIRVMINQELSLLSLDFFEDMILDKLKIVDSISISKLTVNLMSEYYLNDIIWANLIKRLIDNHKIIVINNGTRFFENIISLNS